MILNKRTELYYTFFDGSVNGENNILHSFFAGAGRTPFRAIFALGYSRAGAGCVRADTFRSDESAAVHKAAKHAAQVPALSNGLRLHRSLSLCDHKAIKNGFGGFVVNARMELERKVKKGLTKTDRYGKINEQNIFAAGGLNMTNQKKYVAYVSTYTMGDNHGITIYDVDVENGRFTLKDRVEITNSSYLTISHNRKWLYSITDFGVESYEILKDGHLKPINMAGINGMRGCYLSTDYEDRFLFVAGWHDGKITALRLKEDGSVGEITDEIFHRGLGSIAERNFRPHVSCVKMTRDNHYLCAADLGMDHVKVYRLDHQTGKLTLADVIRSEMESAPRHIKFSRDGRILYIVHELKNIIDVYTYEEKKGAIRSLKGYRRSPQSTIIMRVIPQRVR